MSSEPREETLAKDVRVAEYICGLLSPAESAQVHALLARDDEALAIGLQWEAELLSLVDALPPVSPPASLRERLQRSLNIGPPQAPIQTQLLRRRSQEHDSVAIPAQTLSERAAVVNPAPPAAEPTRPTVHSFTASPTRASPTGVDGAAEHASEPAAEEARPRAKTAGPVSSGSNGSPGLASSAHSRGPSSDHERALLRKLWLWRLIALGAAAAAIVGFMLPGEPPPPPVQIVKVAPTRAAILMAPGTSSTPGWTATLDVDGNLMMQPLVHTEVPLGSQVLLWTRSARVPEPRLLGKIDPNRPVQVPAATLGALAEDQLFEITLEKDEDAAEGVPNGPILFIGQMTVFAAGAATMPDTASGASDASGASAGTITTQP